MNCYRCNPDQDVEHCQWPGRFLDSFPSQLLDPPLLSSGHTSECLSRIGLVCSWTLCEWNHTVWGIFIWLLLTSSFQCEPCDSSVMLQLVPLHCCVVFHHMDVSLYIYIYFFFFLCSWTFVLFPDSEGFWEKLLNTLAISWWTQTLVSLGCRFRAACWVMG